MWLSSHKSPCDCLNKFIEIKHFNQVSCIDLCIIESNVAILFFKISIREKILATSLTEHHSKMKIRVFFLKLSVFLGENL